MISLPGTYRDRDVGVLDRRPEALDLLERRRVVGVAKQDVLGVGVPHPVTDRVAFPVVPLETKHVHRGPSKTSNRPGRVVDTAIVDHQDFRSVGLARQVLAHVRERRADAAGLVQRGNDDGEPLHGAPVSMYTNTAGVIRSAIGIARRNAKRDSVITDALMTRTPVSERAGGTGRRRIP